MTKISAGLGALLILLASFTAQPAGAVQADPLMVLVTAEDWSALEREAKQRLAADPLAAEALHALGRLSIDGEKGSEEMRQSLLPMAESCIKARPYDALCQLAYGQILGTILNGQDGLTALGSVGKVQRALEAAVADAPDNFDARESLVNFYLQAPGFVGGSTRRAIRNAEDFVKFDPDRARLLFAQIDLQQDSPSKAEEEMSGLKQQSGDADLDRLAAKRWLTIGLAYIKSQDHDSAVAALTRAAERGAPSVIQEAREALDRLGAGQSVSGGGLTPAAR